MYERDTNIDKRSKFDRLTRDLAALGTACAMACCRSAPPTPRPQRPA